MPHFTKLDEKEQEHVIWKVSNLVEVCQKLQSQVKSAGDAKALTAEFLKHIDIQPPKGLLEKISPDDSVDIYTEQHQMVFATLAYFKSFTYSLEEFFCRPWTELYASDTPYVYEQYLELANCLLSGRVKGMVKIDSIPNHVAFELLQPGKLAIVAVPKFASPLLESDGRLCGYLFVHTLAPLGRGV